MGWRKEVTTDLPTKGIPFAAALQVDGQVACAYLALRSMDDAVFQDRLHGQFGKAAAIDFFPLLRVTFNGQVKP